MTRTLLAPLLLLATLLYRALYATLRVRAVLADGTVLSPFRYPFGAELFAMCERDALALGGILPAGRFTVLVAPGRDGDLATAAARTLGARAVRGSSRRGGARALGELVRGLSRSPDPCALVVDGPLGPSGRARPGILLLAARTGRPVRPVGAAARRAMVLGKAWSRIYLPLPFTRVEIVCEETLDVPRGTERARLDALAALLSDRLARARERAVAAAGGARA